MSLGQCTIIFVHNKLLLKTRILFFEHINRNVFWTLTYQGRIGNGFNADTSCVCGMLGPGFPTSHVVFICSPYDEKQKKILLYKTILLTFKLYSLFFSLSLSFSIYPLFFLSPDFISYTKKHTQATCTCFVY